MARPRKREPLTAEDLDKIEAMAAAGLTIDQMASIFDMDKRTFERGLADDDRAGFDAVEKGRSKAVFKVGQSAFNQAISGKTPAMTMFYLKCRAGWKETQVVEHAGKLETTPDQDTGAKLDRLMNILQELKKPDES